MAEIATKRLDFHNTEIAFQNKSNKELRKTANLFRLMNKAFLVKVGSNLGMIGIKLRLPLITSLVKNTIFKQFCGGVTLSDCSKNIEKLYKHNTFTVLDYGAESKTEEADLDDVMLHTMDSIEFAATHKSVPFVSCKVTGLARNELLTKAQSDKDL